MNLPRNMARGRHAICVGNHICGEKAARRNAYFTPSGTLCRAAISLNGGGAEPFFAGRWNYETSRAATPGKARQPTKALITASRFGEPAACEPTYGRARAFRELLKTAAELCRGFQITNQVVIIGCCLSGGSCRSWAHSSPSRLHHWFSAPRIRCGTRVSRLLSGQNLGRLSFRACSGMIVMM